MLTTGRQDVRLGSSSQTDFCTGTRQAAIEHASSMHRRSAHPPGGAGAATGCSSPEAAAASTRCLGARSTLPLRPVGVHGAARRVLGVCRKQAGILNQASRRGAGTRQATQQLGIAAACATRPQGPTPPGARSAALADALVPEALAAFLAALGRRFRRRRISCRIHAHSRGVSMQHHVHQGS